MIKILLISNNFEQTEKLNSIFSQNTYDFSHISDIKIVQDEISLAKPDIIIIDQDFNDLKSISQVIKSVKDNTIIIYLTSSDRVNKDALKSANAFITSDMQTDLILSTVNINIRMKNALEMLSNSNKDLADSLYRLNALYATSSKFAGTLDNSELIQYMIEGLDRALSFSLSCTLTLFNEPVLIINSLYELSDELIAAIKMRTILNYSSLFEDKNAPIKLDIDTLKVVKNIKYPANRFTFTMFQYDNLFAPIKLGDDLFGCVEIFKENAFTPDDTTCFQTIVQQVAMPLNSAILYKKLKELEHLKSDFISIVSHELRTPLTSIKNALDLLNSGRCGEMSQNATKFLSMATRNVKTLSGIINDLLDLSKIEAGKMDYKFENVNINTIIGYVKTALSNVALSRGLELILDLTENLPEINGDSRRLEQVLTNLVSNAIKFTPEGKCIKITSKLINSDDIRINDYFKDKVKDLDGDYIQVCVKDEGIGMEGKDMLKAFDKFAQIENSLSRNVGGTGLGLPITKQLLDAHQGAIWCDSEPNKGTTFTFVLPVIKETANV